MFRKITCFPLSCRTLGSKAQSNPPEEQGFILFPTSRCLLYFHTSRPSDYWGFYSPPLHPALPFSFFFLLKLLHWLPVEERLLWSLTQTGSGSWLLLFKVKVKFWSNPFFWEQTPGCAYMYCKKKRMDNSGSQGRVLSGFIILTCHHEMNTNAKINICQLICAINSILFWFFFFKLRILPSTCQSCLFNVQFTVWAAGLDGLSLLLI